MPLAAHPKTLTAPTCKAVQTKKRFSTPLAAAGVASLRDGSRLWDSLLPVNEEIGIVFSTPTGSSQKINPVGV